MEAISAHLLGLYADGGHQQEWQHQPTGRGGSPYSLCGCLALCGGDNRCGGQGAHVLVKALTSLTTRYGALQEIVSDNGSMLVASEGFGQRVKSEEKHDGAVST